MSWIIYILREIALLLLSLFVLKLAQYNHIVYNRMHIFFTESNIETWITVLATDWHYAINYYFKNKRLDYNTKLYSRKRLLDEASSK